MPDWRSLIDALNWVDLVVALIVLVGALEGARRGLLLSALDLLLAAGALVGVLFAAPVAAAWLIEAAGLRPGLAAPLGFLAAALALVIVHGVVRSVLLGGPGPAATGLSFALGALPGAARGALVALVALSFVRVLPLPAELDRAVAGSTFWQTLAEPGDELRSAFSRAVWTAGEPAVALPGARELPPGLPLRPPAPPAPTLPPLDPGQRVELPFRVASPAPDPAAEQRMLELINRERQANGLRPLVADPQLAAVARAYAFDMLQRGYFAHTSPEGATLDDRLRAGGVRFRAAGENLAFNQTVEAAHRALMASPGHRANILNPAFGRVGVGVADGGLVGELFVQNFAD